MKKLDLSGCVPELPQGYMEAMDSTIRRLKAEKGHGSRRAGKIALVAAVAATFLITTAMALSDGFGVMRFLRSFAGNGHILPEADEMVEDLSAFPEVRTSRVVYRAVEALFVDGRLRVTVAARPVDAEKYLLTDDAGWSKGQTKPEGSDKTYAQIADEEARLLLGCEIGIDNVDGSRSTAQKEEETLYIYLDAELPNAAKTANVVLTCMDYPALEEGGAEKVPLAISVRLSDGALGKMSAGAPVRGRDMTVDEAEFVRTPFATVVRVRYTVDKEKAAALDGDSVYCSFFWMRGGAGEEVMQGDASSAQTRLVAQDENGKTFETTRNWQTMGELPDVAYLRPWYWESGEWGEAIEVRSDER